MTTVDVFLDRAGESVRAGQAHFTRRRGRISTTFIYDPGYLAGNGTSIDPALPLVSGAQHQEGLVRAFADSAPDRWGRNLVEKAERSRAREEGRAPRRLDDLDFLLGVSDDTRQGALRFCLAGETRFLGEPVRVPHLISLPELLHAADDLARGEDFSEAVKQLLDTGTTGLGGARPKASVLLDDNSLAIAKFPHSSDRWDVMAWEATALDLLDLVGVSTPERRLTAVGDRSILLLRRFDRTHQGHRVGYISALTALGAQDGEQRDYSDIAEAMRDLSVSLKFDHGELFNRVIASVILGNTDDHLRNHGFLAETGGWRLSPVFDVNPNPDPWKSRSTSIMGADTLPEEVTALVELAQECSMTSTQGRDRITYVAGRLSNWRYQARKNGILESEISMMAEGIDARLAFVTDSG